MKFEVSALLRADVATRSEVYSRALDPIAGWMDVEEIRALEDLPPRRSTPTVSLNGNAPAPVPVEPRSRDDIADVLKAFTSQRPPVVNVNNPYPPRVRRRIVRDEQGQMIAVVDEAENENTTNGNGSAITRFEKSASEQQ